MSPDCRVDVKGQIHEGSSRVEAQATKRLNLIDAMVLVAATATGLALGRAVVSEYKSEPGVDIVVDYTTSVALMWSLAILALNLTRYYTTRLELASRPGFSALVAVVVERTSNAISYAFALKGPTVSMLDWIWTLLWSNVVNAERDGSVAGAVAAVWLVTAMAGCWRPEKSWIDRSGRVLGVFWLLAAVGYWSSSWAFSDAP
jgi:hypothetical protein